MHEYQCLVEISKKNNVDMNVAFVLERLPYSETFHSERRRAITADVVGDDAGGVSTHRHI